MVLKFKSQKTYNKVFKYEIFNIANNEVSGECQLRTYRLSDFNKILHVFQMKIITDYFRISKLTTNLYMLINENTIDIGFF